MTGTNSIKHPLVLLLLIYYLLSAFTLVHWWLNKQYFVAGDEPHYLIIADGIVNHGTFEQTIPYKKEFVERNIFPSGLAPADAMPTPQNTHATLGPNGLFNVHNIGLPLLVAVPYKLGSLVTEFFPNIAHFNVAGIAVAKLFLILLNGFLVIGAWIATGFFADRNTLRIATTAIICFSYPFVPAANQIYPDLLAGVIVLFAVLHLMKNEAGRDHSYFKKIFYLAVAVAFLPWLQIKFAAASSIAVVAITYSEFRARREGRYILVGPLMLAISALLLGCYNFYAFGKVTGPYQGGALELSATSVMVFMGLHLDRFQGIFFQNISFFVALLYLTGFLRRFLFSGFVALLIYSAFVVPNALHPNWYGGGSFAGRFQWSGAVVLIPFVAYALIMMFREFPRVGRTIFGILLAANAYIFVLYNFTNLSLYNKSSDTWPSVYPAFWGVFKSGLPAFYDSSWAFRFFSNYVWLLIVAGFFLLGLLRELGLRREIFSSILFTGVSVCLVLLAIAGQTITQPSGKPLVYSAIQLPSQTGHLVGNKRVAFAANDAPGFLSFGPYIDLPAGKYIVNINYSSTADIKRPIGFYDVCSGPQNIVIIKNELPGTSGHENTIQSEFELNKDVNNLEVRLWFSGVEQISFDGLAIRAAEKE